MVRLEKGRSNRKIPSTRLLLKMVVGFIQVIEYIVNVLFIPGLPSMFRPSSDSLFEFAQRFDVLIFTRMRRGRMADVTVVVV